MLCPQRGPLSISMRPGSAALLPISTTSTGLPHLSVGARVHRVRSDTGKHHVWPLPHTHHFQCMTYIQLIPQTVDSLALHATSPSEIEAIIRSIPNKTSYGHDKISNVILKSLNEAILLPLRTIFNQSISEGRFPDFMKLAKVVPQYKSKEMDIVLNYRLISLVITTLKVLEKIIYKRVYSYLERNNILYNSQYRFRINHNCEQPIMELVSKLLHPRERGEHSVGIFLDLSKVFDTLNHTVLLSKLEQLGIRGVTNKWFGDSLRQIISCENHSENRVVYSEPYQITYGIAQGSCIRPLLFILFCNDIYNLPVYSHLILFADNTTMNKQSQNLNYLEYMMYHNLTILLEWFKANQLSLNISKTVMMNFWPGKKKRQI